MRITVAPYAVIDEALHADRPSHLISLMDPRSMIPTPREIPQGNHLRMPLHDIEEPREGLIHATPDHARTLIDFLRGWDGSAPLLIHCWMGVSRSSAAAYIALCLANEGREMLAAMHLRERGPHAQPNPLLVGEADRLLDRKGRMVAAIHRLGPGDMRTLGKTFSVDGDLGTGSGTARASA